MKPYTYADLFPDPCQPGRWHLHTSHGEHSARWVDLIAFMAQKKWPERVVVLDATAALVSNLRVWENLILPLWWREGGSLAAFEGRVQALFDLTGMDEAQQLRLVQCMPASLDQRERRLVALIRSCLLEPRCVIMHDDWWQDLMVRHRDAIQMKLFAGLQQAECLILTGSQPCPADFVPIQGQGEVKK